MPNIALPDTVQLLIDNIDVTKFVKNYSIETCLFEGPDYFSAEMHQNYYINLTNDIHTYQWIINGKSVQYGHIEKFSVSGDKHSGIKKIIEGRDLLLILTSNSVITEKNYSGYFYNPENHTGILVDFLNDNNQVNSIWSWDQSRKPIRQGKDPAFLNIFQGAITDYSSLFQIQNSDYYFKIELPRETLEAYTEVENVLLNFKFSLIKSSLGESLYDFLTKCTNQMGLIIQHKPDETLTLTISKLYEPVLDINYLIQNKRRDLDPVGAQTNIVKNFNFSEDIKDFCMFIKLLGNTMNEETPDIPGAATENELYGTGKNESEAGAATNEEVYGIKNNTAKSYLKEEGIATYTDNPGSFDVQIKNIGFQGLPKFKTHIESGMDLNIWNSPKDRLQILNNIMINQMRNLYKIEYTLEGHSTKNLNYGGNTPYLPKRLAFINDDYIQLNTNYFVSEVVYRGSKTEGQTTEMKLIISDYTSANNFRGYLKPGQYMPSPPIEQGKKEEKLIFNTPNIIPAPPPPFTSAPSDVTVVNQTSPSHQMYPSQNAEFRSADPEIKEEP